MLSLNQLLNIIQAMVDQSIFTQQQADRLTTAANAILSNFGNEQEYQAKFALFLALLGGKWV